MKFRCRLFVFKYHLLHLLKFFGRSRVQRQRLISVKLLYSRYVLNGNIKLRQPTMMSICTHLLLQKAESLKFVKFPSLARTHNINILRSLV
ncbi:MAG: hypothetical protein RMY28_003730 [Nostoc sp. ChiSLP01]|nr:hypothetical protein [Nostoc sp. CmiSLP01]MDZ8286212.1 hypothetical protein [Nostoc sp. ChiSLP01]